MKRETVVIDVSKVTKLILWPYWGEEHIEFDKLLIAVSWNEYYYLFEDGTLSMEEGIVIALKDDKIILAYVSNSEYMQVFEAPKEQLVKICETVSNSISK